MLVLGHTNYTVGYVTVRKTA